MHRLGLIAALGGIMLLASIPALASAAQGEKLEPMAPGVYSPSEGVPGAPAGSCAAEPEQVKCPPVSKIVVSAPTGGDTTEYAPINSDLDTADLGEQEEPQGLATDLSAESAEAAPQAVGYNICAVTVGYPHVTSNNHPHARGENTCAYGYGVVETDLLVALQKIQANGNVQWRGSTSGTHYGAGTFAVNHYGNCNGRNGFVWESYAYAYTVIGTVAYAGTDQKFRSMPCN
ncbi:MAG: hypothetical protein R2725_10665 [Solirubrobacterales bacterium]